MAKEIKGSAMLENVGAFFEGTGFNNSSRSDEKDVPQVANVKFEKLMEFATSLKIT